MISALYLSYSENLPLDLSNNGTKEQNVIKR